MTARKRSRAGQKSQWTLGYEAGVESTGTLTAALKEIVMTGCGVTQKNNPLASRLYDIARAALRQASTSFHQGHEQ